MALVPNYRPRISFNLITYLRDNSKNMPAPKRFGLVIPSALNQGTIANGS